MKLRDLQRHLRTHGATIARDRGNHTIWRLDTRTAPVPRHREIAPRHRGRDLQAAQHSQATQSTLIASPGVLVLLAALPSFKPSTCGGERLDARLVLGDVLGGVAARAHERALHAGLAGGWPARR